MFLQQHKTEIFIFSIIFIVYSFFTILKIANNLPAQNLASDQYFQIAANLVEKHSFSLDGANPTALRMPGYPFFLAFALKILRNWWLIIFLQNIISGLTAVFLYLIAKKWLPSLYAAGASIIWALEPYAIDISQQFLTETIYTFFVIISVFIFIKCRAETNKKIFFPAIILLLSILTYIKPLSLFLPFIFIAALIYHQRTKSAVPIIAILIAYIIFLSPWLLRNHSLFGSWQLSSDNASSLYITSLYFKAEESDAQKPPPEIPEESGLRQFEKSGDLSQSSIELKSAISVIVSNPLRFSKFYFKNFVIGIVKSSWYGSIKNLLRGSSGNVNYHKGVKEAIFNLDVDKILHFSAKEIAVLIIMLSGIIFWLLILALAFLGTLFSFKYLPAEDRSSLILLIGIIAYLLLIGNMAIDDMIRYRFPASPFIAMFAMYGFFSLFRFKSIKQSI